MLEFAALLRRSRTPEPARKRLHPGNGKEEEDDGSDEQAPAEKSRAVRGAGLGEHAIRRVLLRGRSMSAKLKTTPDKTKAVWPFMAQNRKSGDKTNLGAPQVQGVTQGSNVLELAEGVFTWDDPRAIAQSLKDSADMSERRRAPAFQSAMSVLTFYINRAGSKFPAAQRACLEAAKDELRALYGRARHGKPILDAESKNKRGASGAPSFPAKKFIERRSSPGS